MADLRCADCGTEATYGEVMLVQVETTCEHQGHPGDTRHDFQEI